MMPIPDTPSRFRNQPAAPRRRVGASVACALALVLAVAACCGDSVLGSTSSSAADTSSSTSTAPAATSTTAPPATTTTTTIAPTTTTFPVGAWHRVPDDETIFGNHPAEYPAARNQGIYAVAAGGPGVVAVGYATSVAWGIDATVWISADGITWTRAPHDDAVFSGVYAAFMNDIAVGGPGFVAVGIDSPIESDPPSADIDTMVWTSVDGITWARVPHDPVLFGGPDDQRMSAVAAGGPGLVAVGSDGDDAAVWTSPDGVAWTRVPHDEAVFGGPGTYRISDVADTGSGLVAVGGDGDSAAVWTSPDGASWTRVPHDEAVFGGPGLQRMNSVAAAGPGLVAAGTDIDTTDPANWDGDAAIWVSADGVVWSRVAHDEALFGGAWDQLINSVIVGPPGIVAVGEDRGAATAVVWTSPDGLTWTRLPQDPAVFGDFYHAGMMDVAVGGPGLVAVGTAGVEMSGGNGAAWYWTPS
jgi:hypothetical protein